jgi:hypothetical protein
MTCCYFLSAVIPEEEQIERVLQIQITEQHVDFILETLHNKLRLTFVLI